MNIEQDFETVRAVIENSTWDEVVKDLNPRTALSRIEAEVERLRAALEELAEWPLPRWVPDDPQTEGEQMRLFARQVLEEVEKQ